MKRREVKLRKYDAPHLQRIYELGIRHGADLAANTLQDFMDERIESLKDIPGIGGKTIDKIVEHFKEGMNK